MLMTAEERTAWLDRRRTGVGASEVAGILGISTHHSAWSVWADKVGLYTTDDDPSVDMKFGRYAELMVAPWFHDETGLYVVGEQSECTNPGAQHHRCTVDGFTAESPDADLGQLLGLLQIKTRQPGKRWATIPEDIQAQEQWEMHCTGLSKAWVAVLMGRRLDVHELARDQADIDFMVERVDRFWSEHVLAGVPPDVDGSDATARAIEAVHPKPNPDTSVALDHLVGTLDEWRTAKGLVKQAEARVNAAANRLKAELGDAEEGTVAGERAVTWRLQERGSYTVEASSFRTLRDSKKGSKK